MDSWERLELLLSQDQFEIVDFSALTPGADQTDCKVIYLLNDTAESFLIFKNARYTGEYIEDYEGPISYSLDRQQGMLRVNQGESHLLLFFDDLEFEVLRYNYGGIGHFWVEGFEDLRNLEFQIAILRDKYDYLGPEFCTEREKELSSLKRFPPLTYLFYSAAPEKYIVSMEDAWTPSDEALHCFQRICLEAGDHGMNRLLIKYRRNPSQRMAGKIAKCLRKPRHKVVADHLYEELCLAAEVYPRRKFPEDQEEAFQKQWEKAEALSSEYSKKGIPTRIYREEPFVCGCDQITFHVYVMVFEKGLRYRKTKIIKIEPDC